VKIFNSQVLLVGVSVLKSTDDFDVAGTILGCMDETTGDPSVSSVYGMKRCCLADRSGRLVSLSKNNLWMDDSNCRLSLQNVSQ
jgi:hypothetical protein